MSRRRTRIALAVAAILLGLAHLALTPLAYRAWTLETLWFVGTGLAIVIAASANLSPQMASARATIAANIVMAGFFVAAWTVLPGPQTIAGGFLFLGLAACGLIGEAGQPSAAESR